MWDAMHFSGQVEFFGGSRIIDTVRVLIFCALVFDLLVHVYLGRLGDTRLANFNAMISAYEDLEEKPTAPVVSAPAVAPQKVLSA
ncbi:hypothetical protein ASD45_09805 [Pseudolabrys sp. Root1462]|nr:hypothetical protein ASD45_09805 [Pseudolabrys sp. Root1462]